MSPANQSTHQSGNKGNGTGCKENLAKQGQESWGVLSPNQEEGCRQKSWRGGPQRQVASACKCVVIAIF